MAPEATCSARDPVPSDWIPTDRKEVLSARDALQAGGIRRRKAAFRAQQGATNLSRGRATNVDHPKARRKNILANGHGATTILVVLHGGFAVAGGLHGETHAALEEPLEEPLKSLWMEGHTLHLTPW